ncbi:MAG: MFS transporter [Actinomycetota bacterium]|nr:MFS transporter [Actinomycetota bacterium]
MTDFPEMPVGDARSSRLRWGTLAVLSISIIMLNLDNTILNVALPTLVRDLHSSSSQLQWIVDSYILVFAGLLLTGGSLGDRLGRKWVFMAGLAVFGAGSVASAFSGSSNMLIATRAFMGIGGAMAMPSTLSIITNVFLVPRERARAIAIWSGSSGLGVALGPIAGGWLLDHYWWGSVFLVNAPVVALGLIAAFFLVPNSVDPGISKPDPVGSILSIGALGTIIWAIIEAPNKGWTSASTLAAFAAGIGLLVAFLVVESKSSHPMLRLGFFENRRFSVAATSIAIVFFSLMGASFLLTQYLQFVRGYSPLRAGELLLGLAGALLIFAPLSAIVAHHIGTKITVAFGLALAAMGAVFLGRYHINTSLVAIEVPLALVGIGLAFTMPPSAESVMGSVPRAQAGVGSATNGTLIQVGGAMGVAVMGSVLSTAYRSHLVAAQGFSLLPAPLAAAAKSSLGTALQVATRLPGVYGSALAQAAKSSFMSGFGTTMWVSVGTAFAGALIALVALPARAKADPDFDLAPRLDPATDVGEGVAGG